jgi:predicted DNA-binding transcriptional regulator AlpA
MSPNELAGIAEVAALLGVSKQTAIGYSQRADFPAPLERLKAGPVWRVGDIEEWAARTLPLATGRPRKEQG